MEKLKALFDGSCRRVAVGAGLGLFGSSAFAVETFDVTDSTANIAAGLAAAILVSLAMTAAVIAVRASKLPRRGA